MLLISIKSVLSTISIRARFKGAGQGALISIIGSYCPIRQAVPVIDHTVK